MKVICEVCGKNESEFQVLVQSLKKVSTRNQGEHYPVLCRVASCAKCLPYEIQRTEQVEVKTVTLRRPIGAKP